MNAIEKPTGNPWQTFERMCLTVFEKEFNAPRARFYGKPGIGQNGIDIRMRCNYPDRAGGAGRDTLIVIQCKAYQAVQWSTFSSDFKNAVNAFGPKNSSDPDLLFVLATTAGGVNDSDIAEKARRLLHHSGEIDAGIDINRVAHREICWPEIDNIIRDHKSLRELFMATEWDADNTRDKDLDDLQVDLALLARAKGWARMRVRLDEYRAAKAIGRTDFGWVPRTLMKDLAELFLAAADFAPALALLRHAVSLDPIDGFDRLGYLRACRFLQTFPNDSRSVWVPGHFPASHHRPYHPRTLEEEIDRTADAMLAAKGTLDERLTLVLWILSYTMSRQTADLALSRALDQLTQVWPQSVTRWQPTDSQAATDDGAMVGPIENCLAPRPLVDANRFAAAAAVFDYLRRLRNDRFGGAVHPPAPDVTLPVIAGSPDQPPNTFFGSMHKRLDVALRHYFPKFWEEADGRDARWLDFGARDAAPATRLQERRYVVSSVFLLRDCVGGVMDERLAAVRQGPRPGSGAAQYLVTSNADLEHIVRMRLALQIHVASKGPDAQHAAVLLNQIKSVIEHVMRPDDLKTRTDALIRSLPVYSEAPEPGYQLFQAFELSQEHGFHLIAATPGEFRLAHSRHPIHEERLHNYTRPLVGPPMN